MPRLSQFIYLSDARGLRKCRAASLVDSGPRPGRNPLSLAVDDLAVHQGALDDPVRLALTENARIDAFDAQIIVAAVAAAAVPVLVLQRLLAVVAEDTPVHFGGRRSRQRILGADSQVGRDRWVLSQ